MLYKKNKNKYKLKKYISKIKNMNGGNNPTTFDIYMNILYSNLNEKTSEIINIIKDKENYK